MKDRNVKQVLMGNGYQLEGSRGMERVKEGEYGGCTSYTCMKIGQ
jgi:hypothetical protein